MLRVSLYDLHDEMCMESRSSCLWIWYEDVDAVIGIICCYP